MTKRRAKTGEQAAFWHRHVRAWTSSRETAAAYAKRHGLAVQSLYQAKHRLSREARIVAPASAAFARVELRNGPETLARTTPEFRMRLPNGVVLEWESAPATSEIVALIHRDTAPR
jgi:hypothetical protein